MAPEATEQDPVPAGKESTAVTNVCVVYTGGTIGMVPAPDQPGSPLTPADEEALKKNIPGLAKALGDKGIHFEIVRLKKGDTDEQYAPLDSSDVKLDHWVAIARAIEDNYEAFDGFVVLHGTDTMAYTCSALSFLLHNLSKPVVVTGSQLPIAEARTDGLLNFINALYIAGYKATDLPLIPEVVLAFADKVFRGNRLTKVSTTHFQGFDTPNYPPLGELGEHIKIDASRVRKPSDQPFYVDRVINEDDVMVVVLTLYPGFRANLLRRVAEIENVRGLVLRTFGAGNAPTEVGSEGLIDEIARTVSDLRIQVVNVTQCIQGQVEAGLYEASSGLLDAGVLSGLDMTEEAALTKLMWLLGTEADPQQIPLQMQIDLRDEQSESLFDIHLTPPSGRSNTYTATPPGQFRKANLKKATMRLSGLKPQGVGAGDTFRVKAFINLPNAGMETNAKDPHFAFEEAWPYSKDGVTYVKDVTNTVRQIVEDGRSISVTFALDDDVSINPPEDLRVSLSLFCTD